MRTSYETSLIDINEYRSRYGADNGRQTFIDQFERTRGCYA